jgi:alginate O-acetyltransferase complex protein AlgJ
MIFKKMLLKAAPRFEVVHRHLAAIAFIFVLVFGAGQYKSAVRTLSGLDFPRTSLDFWEGRTTAQLERQLDLKMPLRGQIIGYANAMRFASTSGAGDQVRAGRDGWLFLTEELRFDGEGPSNLLSRVELLRQTNQALGHIGAKLIVVLVPDKSRVYSTYLQSGRYPSFNETRYQKSIAAFQSNGITAVDILTPLMAAKVHNTVYYKTDTHWNQVGAHIAAEAVAETAKKYAKALDRTEFTSINGVKSAPRTGDLVRLMGLEDLPDFLRPQPDVEVPVTTHQTSADGASSLFGESTVSVTLIGTSYSLRGNFHGFLQQALSAKILNIAKDGGGFLQSATQYFTDESFHQTKPKLVIWEIPERFLYAKLEGERAWLEKVRIDRP